jgi:hyperosmotically inducible periplasmic protein
MNIFQLALIGIAGTVTAVPWSYAANETAPHKTAPDNSRVNKGIVEGDQKTAQDQSGHQSDVEITRMIRRELTSDDELSTYAKNVKIVVDGNSVTLKGPVRSAAEKQRVVAAAKQAAPQCTVHDQISIAP